MHKGSRGMGHSKHRKSGRSGKSPKTRLRNKMEAEKNERRARQSTTLWKGSVKDALRGT